MMEECGGCTVEVLRLPVSSLVPSFPYLFLDSACVCLSLSCPVGFQAQGLQLSLKKDEANQIGVLLVCDWGCWLCCVVVK